MRVWYDTEFLERGPSLPIELISIGMVREDGETLYLINADMSLSQVMRNPWLQMNVVPLLPIKVSGMHSGVLNGIIEWDSEHADIQNVVAADTIAERVRDFVAPHARDELGDISDKVEPGELWAYYGAYDHVVLSQLFGSMSELPPGMPMFTNDIMQEWTRLGNPAILPKVPDIEHNALGDALWCKAAWDVVSDWRDWISDTHGGPPGADDVQLIEEFTKWRESNA